MDLLFAADVHLGKLARLLRMLGIDTVYSNSFNMTELLKVSAVEGRIVLSRNPALDKIAGTLPFFIVQSEDPVEQLEAVLNQFPLQNQINPFSLCMACNGKLIQVSKEQVKDQLEPNTLLYYHEFWQCDHCKKLYWKGPHYQRMSGLINQLKQFFPLLKK